MPESLIEHEVTGSPRQKGFKTYKDYYQSSFPFEKGLDDQYFKEQGQSSENPGGYTQAGSITMVDISVSGSVFPPHRFPLLEGGPIDPRHREDFQRATRCHGNGLRTRIVISDYWRHTIFYDFFALEYGLDPELFRAIFGYFKRLDGKIFDPRSVTAFLPWNSCSKDKPELLNLGYGRFALCFERECGTTVKHDLNIVFIFWTPPRRCRDVQNDIPIPASILRSHFRVQSRWDVTAEDRPSAISRYVLSDYHDYYNDYKVFVNLYNTLLLNWPYDRVLEANLNAMLFLAPCLDFKFAELYTISTLLSESHGTNRESLHTAWRALRADIESTAASRYSWDRLWDPTGDPQPRDMFAIDHDHAMECARRMESLIRDEQQLEVGRLSLEESKKAIQQAELGIKEGKRMKMLTIIAFVFLPASLSTSAFGMNLRELSTPSVWVFVLTTVVIFSVSFLLWFTIYQFNLAIHAPRSQRTMGEGLPLSKRLHCLFWLIRHRHIIFLFRSGIAISLLSGGRIGFLPACQNKDCSARLIPNRLGLDIAEPHDPNRPWAYVTYHMFVHGGDWTARPFSGVILNYRSVG